MTAYTLYIVAAVVIAIIASSLRVLREYERGVVFMLGRFWKVKGPGLILVIPVIQQMVRVDLRIIVMDVPSQDVISQDNVSVKVNAVVYFRVLDSQKAIINVENYYSATSQLAQTTLRSVLGKHDLDEMLAERDKLNSDIQGILDAQMIRAIAKQAEAERVRRAKIIHAEGEMQASQKLYEAAEVLGQNPSSLLLRYMQTLTEIGSEQNSTIVFPLPIDLFKPFMETLQNQARGADTASSTE